MGTGRAPVVCALIAITALSAGCAGEAAGEPTGEPSFEPTDAPATSSTTTPTTTEATTTTSPATTTTSTTTSTTSTTTTSTSTTTSTTTTTIPGPAEVIQLGESVLGRPIVAERFGELGGRPVLVIGVIHGNEDDGVAIIEELRRLGAPDGVELWLVESMNPDGQAAQDRHNANKVDLNRNFPYNWGPIGEPGDPQYAGPAPASEPETQAMVGFISDLRPDITIWYHQDLFMIAPAEGREGRVRERYAELTEWPIGRITGGTYTGVAATWARNEMRPDDGVAFIVELGPTLSAEEATTHAEAVRTIATEG